MATAKVYRAEMGEPPMPDEGAPGPKDMMGKMVIGKESDVTPAERRKIERDMKMASEPVKKAKGGSASSRADGIAKRGKTRGTIVMCGGGMYKK